MILSRIHSQNKREKKNALNTQVLLQKIPLIIQITYSRPNEELPRHGGRMALNVLAKWGPWDRARRQVNFPNFFFLQPNPGPAHSPLL